MRSIILAGFRLTGLFYIFVYGTFIIHMVINLIEVPWSPYTIVNTIVIGLLFILALILLTRPHWLIRFTKVEESDDNKLSLSKKDVIETGIILICFFMLVSQGKDLWEIAGNLAIFDGITWDFEIVSKHIYKLLYMLLTFILIKKSSAMANWLVKRDE